VTRSSALGACARRFALLFRRRLWLSAGSVPLGVSEGNRVSLSPRAGASRLRHAPIMARPKASAVASHAPVICPRPKPRCRRSLSARRSTLLAVLPACSRWNVFTGQVREA